MRIYAIFTTFLVMAFSSAAVGQGLPFTIEDYDEESSSWVITPNEGGTTLADLQKLAPMVTANARLWEMSPAHEVFSQTIFADKATASFARPDSLSGFIEAEYIRRPGAAALQVILERVDLGDAKLVITALDTLQEQPFSGSQLQEAAGQTAIFFGTESLQLQLIAPQGTETIPLKSIVRQVVTYSSLEPVWSGDDDEEIDGLEQAASPLKSEKEKEEALCGDDSRDFSNHLAVGRVVPRGCTAFLLEGGAVATSGHCFRTTETELSVQTVIFNVPKPDPNAVIQPTQSLKDSYALIPTSIICSDCVIGQNLPHGSDWAVFRLAANSISTLTAAQTQQTVFRVPQTLAVQGNQVFVNNLKVKTVAVSGYGWDNDPPEARYSQQSAIGPLGAVTSDSPTHVRLSHGVDTHDGNSGSPIVLTDGFGGASLDVIGINNGGRCLGEGDTGNGGTSFTLDPLQKALAAIVSQN